MPVDVGALRQAGRIDLHDRSDHYEMPIGPEARGLADEADVHALVDDAEEAEPRMRDVRLILRLRRAHAARLGEMIELDARREWVHAVVAAALGFVETHAAGEDEIGLREQLLLQREQFLRSAPEGRQLIHVVVDAQVAFEMARERQRHRRVVPEDAARLWLAGKQLADQLALRPDHVLRALRQNRNGDDDPAGPVADLDMRVD